MQSLSSHPTWTLKGSVGAKVGRDIKRQISKVSDPMRPHVDRQVLQTVLAFIDCIVSTSSSRPAAAEQRPPPPPPPRPRPVEGARAWVRAVQILSGRVRPHGDTAPITRHRLMGPCLWPHPTVGICGWPQTWHGLHQGSNATSVSCAAHLDCVYND